jgi:hypothetical protein
MKFSLLIRGRVSEGVKAEQDSDDGDFMNVSTARIYVTPNAYARPDMPVAVAAVAAHQALAEHDF